MEHWRVNTPAALEPGDASSWPISAGCSRPGSSAPASWTPSAEARPPVPSAVVAIWRNHPAKPVKMRSSMAATEKSPSEQAAEIQKLIGDAQDRLSQAKWALQTRVERLDAHKKETKG